MSKQRFVDKVVIITGSSSGIGQDAAVEFAKEGASVVIHGQNAERLKETEKMILSTGVPAERILAVIGSMENKETPEKIINATLEKFGKINVLINNAGCGAKPGIAPEDFTNMELLEFIYAVNLRSAIHLCILALPHLKKTNGNVLNISSIASTRILPPFLFYAVSKAGLDHWTRGFSVMAAPEVRVNTLNPGPIETPIFDRVNASTELLDSIRTADPLGRFGQCSEMSKCMLFLCSDEASYVTGATLVADGGLSLVK